MDNSIAKAYDTFGRVYDQMARSRGHYEKQVQAILECFERLGVSTSDAILDAACGSGAVIQLLANEGFRAVQGSDGSRELLALARGSDVSHVHWHQLPTFLVERGKVDVLYFMGHSLPHAKLEDLPSILRGVHTGLRPDGWILFDQRKWNFTQAGLREPGRTIGTFEALPNVVVDGDEVRLAHRCDYIGDIQKITYRYGYESLDSIEKSTNATEVALNYSMFSRNESFRLLEEAGFLEPRTLDGLDWPYEVIAAQKKAAPKSS